MKNLNQMPYNIIFLFSIFINFALAQPKEGTKKSEFDDFDQEPITSPFTTDLDELKEKYNSQIWQKIQDELGGKPSDLKITCYKDEKSKTAIGMRQTLLIKAPFQRVKSVMEDIDSYANLFPDFAEVKVLEKRGSKWLTSWEQSVPFPFPNVHYRMMYKIEYKEKSAILRYQLTYSKTLIYSDGLIILVPDEADRSQTLYFEIDFWDADYGMGAALAPDSIRNASVEGVYISDKAVQFKAENPSLSHKQALQEAQKSIDRKAVEACIKNRKSFKSFWN